MIELQELSGKLCEGNVSGVSALTERLLQNGIPPQTILNDGLIAGMEVVGKLMNNCQIYLPEVLQSARAMRAAMDLLKPHLLREGMQPLGRMVLGTVKGDLHDIGKNLVGIMLQGAGIEVIDLGVNNPPEKFVEAIKQHHPSLVGMSALLTTTMVGMKKTIEAITEAGMQSQVKVMIGGAPITQRFADEIGADGFARDAAGAAVLAKALLAKTTTPS
jgi:5-methyltetrahydrofolate--homocysteine methyltransferase